MSRNSLVILFALTCNIISSQNTRSKDILPKNVFKSGEQVKYKIYYKFSEAYVNCGKAVFEVKDKMIKNINHLELRVTGRTTLAFDIFYKVRDEYASVINPTTFLPILFARRVNEGGFHINKNYIFNHDSLTVKSETVDSKNSHAHKILQIDTGSLDVVSAIYYCRNIDYSYIDSGDVVEFPIFMDNERYKFGIQYHGNKTIETENGTFNCMIIKPKLLKGRVFASSDAMSVYITNDDKKLPIYIEANLAIGSVIAILEYYKSGK